MDSDYRDSAELPGTTDARRSPGTAQRRSTLTPDVSDIDFVFETVALDFHRSDRGTGETKIETVAADDILFIRADMGFSMAGVAHVSDTAVVIGATSGSPRSPIIWDGHHARPQDVFLYGPGSTQRGIDPDGMRAEILSVRFTAVEELADRLGVHIRDWRDRRGLAEPQVAQTILTMMRSGFGELDRGSEPLEAIRLAVHAFSEPYVIAHGPRPTHRGLSDTSIVTQVIEHLDEKGRWFPSIAELCTITAVSERRLRAAFVTSYGMPPSKFLRLRALSEVRRCLLEASAETETVTRIALDHGFRHVGDFGQYYRLAFGTSPVSALKSAAKSAAGSVAYPPGVVGRPIGTRAPG
jgi:AraC-like DNA-binding protein